MRYYRIMNSPTLHIQDSITNPGWGIRLLCGLQRHPTKVQEVVYREGFTPDIELLCKRCSRIDAQIKLLQV